MKKKTTSLGMKLVAFLAMLMLFCIPAYAGVVEEAGEYEIYPTPQNVTYGDQRDAAHRSGKTDNRKRH